MTTVKFDKSVKYAGVRYAAHEAFTVADEDVAQLKEAGATIVSTESTPPPQPEPQGLGEEAAEDAVDENSIPSDEDVAQLKEELLGYTVSALTQFARERNIDLQGKTRKADIYNVIVAELN